MRRRRVRAVFTSARRAAGRRPLARDESGVAAVEFALVAPLMLLLVFAMIDLSRAYYTTNQLVSAVREGARVAAVLDTPTDGSQLARVRTAVERFVPFGGKAITDDQVAVTMQGPVGDKTVTVAVQDYPFTLITPFAGTVGLKTINLSRQATFRWERN